MSVCADPTRFPAVVFARLSGVCGWLSGVRRAVGCPVRSPACGWLSGVRSALRWLVRPPVIWWTSRDQVDVLVVLLAGKAREVHLITGQLAAT